MNTKFFSIFLAFSCWGCNGPISKSTQLQARLQERFTTETRQALTHFQSLQRTDTLDFGKLTPFDWDTVYVFKSYTDEYHIEHDMRRKIKWLPVLNDNAAVPEETNRFIFVKGNEAISYVDIGRDLVDDIHFTKYYLGELGQGEDSFIDTKGNYHPYTTNHFAKIDARFIIVRSVGTKNNNASSFVYMPLYLIKSNSFLPAMKLGNTIDLHSISGCGHTNCLANLKKAKLSM